MRYFFAGVADQTAAYDSAVHAVEDWKVYSFEISQREGEYPLLEMEIENPGVGLLSQTGLTRIIVSYLDSDSGEYRVIFRGRVAGFPRSITGPTITVEFVGRADDAEARLKAAHEIERETAYFDELFVDRSGYDDPSESLDARGADWHWNRLDLSVSLSDALVGSRVIDLGSEVFAGGDPIQLTDPPISKVRVSAEVEWTQKRRGKTDLKFWAAKQMGSYWEDDYFQTYTPKQIQWLKPGDSVGPGWRVIKAGLLDAGRNGSELGPYTVGVSFETREPTIDPDAGACRVSGQSAGQTERIAKRRNKKLQQHWMRVEDLLLGWDYEQARRERVEIEIAHDHQPIFGEQVQTEEVEVGALQDVTIPPRAGEPWSSAKASLAPTDGGYQIGDRVRSYNRFFECTSTPVSTYSPARLISYSPFETDGGTAGFAGGWTELLDERPLSYLGADNFIDRDRGLKVIDHLIDIGLDRLRRSARCIEVKFSTAFDRAWDITLDDSVRVADTTARPFVPNGWAEGKVVGYRLVADGDTGEEAAEITIGCSVGTGAAMPTGARTTPMGLGYDVPAIAEPSRPVLTGLLDSPTYAVVEHIAAGTYDQQAAAVDFNCTPATTPIADVPANPADPATVVRDETPTFEFEMRDIRPEEILQRDVAVSSLLYPTPKGIDLS